MKARIQVDTLNCLEKTQTIKSYKGGSCECESTGLGAGPQCLLRAVPLNPNRRCLIRKIKMLTPGLSPPEEKKIMKTRNKVL